MISLHEDLLAPEKLLLDPNNYRFQDLEGFVYAAEERFHEDSVQKKAYQRIRQEEGLQELLLRARNCSTLVSFKSPAP